MKPMFIVMRKELRELFRDKRVRNNAIVMPLIMMLVLLSMFGFISGVGDKSNQVVHVVSSGNKLTELLKAEKVKVVEVANRAEGEKLIREGKARLLLQFEPDFDAKIASGQSTTVEASYDPQQDTGKIALGSVAEEVAKLDQKAALSVMQAKHIDPKELAPIDIKKTEIQVGTSGTNEFLIILLPYLIVLYAFMGGMAAGSDSVAGEKEKMTLETLLMAPVNRTHIAIGKFLAVAVICFLSSFSALMGVVLAGSSHAPIYAKIFANGVGVNLYQIAMIVVILIPTVAFFGSLLIAVSAFAKNSRESQSFMALISVLVIMPAVFGQVIGLTDLASNWWIKLVPVLNTSITVRESLQGKSDPLGVALTIGMGALLALIGIRIAVYLFKREQVLTRV